jgi:receptor protein-tyrosine kinase/non-specific protein-tyrosine kinase
MSRIEKALEKAAKLREAGVELPARQVVPVVPVAEKNCDFRRSLQAEPLQVRDSSLVCALPGQHPAAEEYKKLKSLILQRTRGEAFRNTLLISSCVSEEGKSMTALNLAVTMARDYDHTVLLVDGDLRRPTLHKLLNIEPQFGLLQCLKEDLPLERALIKTGLGKLVLLPAGGVADDPAELLSSTRMRSLVAELKNRYPERYVIFDTPPALLFADAQVLAGMVDSLLFVVREGKAKSAQVTEALSGFQDTKLLGVVYNDAAQLQRSQRYHYYY